MDAQAVIGIVSLGFSVIIAVTVPIMSFRLALRQDHARWLREQRAQVYVDLLTEAYAEKEWMTYGSYGKEARAEFGSTIPDLRMAPLERARLGTRGNMYASRVVMALFSRMAAEDFWAKFGVREFDDGGMRLRYEVGRAFDQLEAAVREEMKTDVLLESGHADLLSEPHPADRESQRAMARMRRQADETRDRFVESDPESEAGPEGSEVS